MLFACAMLKQPPSAPVTVYVAEQLLSGESMQIDAPEMSVEHVLGGLMSWMSYAETLYRAQIVSHESPGCTVPNLVQAVEVGELALATG